MKVKYNVAVASSDGKLVNRHFGRADKFYIYEIADKTFSFVEERDTKAICNGGSHEESDFNSTIELLKDCKVVIVSQIGYAAEKYIGERGLVALEIPGFIDEVLEKLSKRGELIFKGVK